MERTCVSGSGLCTRIKGMQCRYFTNVPISCKNACMCVFVPFQHNIFYSLYVKQL